MNAVNYSYLRRYLKSYMDRVYEKREPLIVTRNNNENVVVMSIDQYNNLVEPATYWVPKRTRNTCSSHCEMPVPGEPKSAGS